MQEVLKIRQAAIVALTTTGPTPQSERYSSTFVANAPGGGVITSQQMQAAFAKGTVKYASVEMKLDYAGSHGPDMVVLMGEEIVVQEPVPVMRVSVSAAGSLIFSVRRMASGATMCGTPVLFRRSNDLLISLCHTCAPL